MKRLIVDTGIWYAAFDESDDKHSYSQVIKKLLDEYNIIIPFPSLYETLNTRFIRNKHHQVDSLNILLKDPNKVLLVNDDNYRERALKAVTTLPYKYSLVDMIIRLMIEDTSLGSVALLTFNVKDFVGINNTEIIDPQSLQ
ncbi:MAG: hypothetical protein J1F05_03035 [Muribaculaceae bacterium]|nr:hypothetical protein [Muribaculaceae bacterium]